MKLTDIVIKTKCSTGTFGVRNDKKYTCVEVPTAGEIQLTLPDGTVIVFTTSEWSCCYIKVSEK